MSSDPQPSALPPVLLPTGDFAGYIFDCDGTLADSMPPHYRAWRQAFITHGARFDFTWELFYSMAGTGLHDSVVILNQRFGDALDPDLVVATQSDLLEREQQSIRPITPVLELARELARKHPVAVASGGSRKHVYETLEVIGARQIFPVIVTKEDVLRSKPAPDTFLRAAECLGVPPAQCLVFEDSHLGLQAADAAGMRWVYIAPELYSTGP